MGTDTLEGLLSRKRSLTREKNSIENNISSLTKENVKAEKLKEEYKAMDKNIMSTGEELEKAVANMTQAIGSFTGKNKGVVITKYNIRMTNIHTKLLSTSRRSKTLKENIESRITKIEKEIEDRKKQITKLKAKINSINSSIRIINNKISKL